MHHYFTRARLITLAASSFFLFLFSIVLAFVIVPLVIDSQIDKNTRLERGTDQWDRFEELPFNISLNITFFEVQNLEGVINRKELPILVEKGPYIFDQVLKKTDISYHDENETVSYYRQADYIFNATRSGPDLSVDDKIALINPALLAVYQMVKILVHIPFAPRLLDRCLNKMFPFGLAMTNNTVNELLFEGVKICDFNAFKCLGICKFFRHTTKTIEEVGDNRDKREHYMKFSFLNYKRQKDGRYEVKTGMSNIAEVGTIKSWEFSEFTNFWVQGRQNNICDFVKGTDGTIFPPHITEDTTLSVYSTDICRSVDIYYDGPGSYRDIDGLIFKTKPTLFYSSTSDPAEDCFCNETTTGINGEDTCFLDGVMDIYPCMGAPVVLSFPHFLYADKKYLQYVDGLKPDKDKHDLYVLLDKYTGVPLQAHERIQMNIVLRPVDDFHHTQHLSHALLPIMWLDTGIDLPDNGIDLLNSLLYDTLTIVDILKWVFMGGSLSLTILSFILLSKHCYSS